MRTGAKSFCHEAMNTLFRIRLPGEDARTVHGLARQCFDLIDYLEDRLSRYREGSDIWQINHLQTGQELFISDACAACLRVALRMHAASGGLFDVTLGRQIEHLKRGTEGPLPPLNGQLSLDPGRPRIVCLEAGREIDLGGIGKGFALDECRKLLTDWGIRSGLLSAGNSTQLAFGPETWPIELAGDRHRRIIELQNTALSASGTGVQGEHILSPKEGSPVPSRNRVWAVSASAACADAWSTVFFLDGDLSPAGIETLQALYCETTGSIVQIT